MNANVGLMVAFVLASRKRQRMMMMEYSNLQIADLIGQAIAKK